MTTETQLTPEALSRRAAGRSRYNRRRQLLAQQRLTQVIRLLGEIGFRHGYQTRIAEQLGVHRSTICRDIARLNRIRWGGRKADERYRADQPMERRIRAEDKAEVERANQDPSESEAVEDASLANSPVQPPVPVPPTQLPRRLASLGSDLGSRLRPEASRSRHRRGA